jgi:NHL repeat-containing protein
MRWCWAISLFGSAGVAMATGCGSDTTEVCAHQAPGTVCEVAGTGELAFLRDGLPASETAFYLPSEVRRGPDGLLYIMDFNNMRLRRIEANGTVSTIAGDGFHAGATQDVAATDSSLENPIDFDFLPDGRVVFVQYHDPRVLVIDHDGVLRRIAGNPSPGLAGNEGDGGPAERGLFLEIAGIAVAPDGTIFVSDDIAHRIRVIRNGTIDTYAGNGTAGYLGDGGPARAAALNAPSALALDAAGNLYTSDTGNHTVRKIAADGTIATVAGTGERGFSGDGGLATGAALAHPDGVAVTRDGTVYIGDGLNHRVRAVAPDGTIATYAGTGEAGMTGNGGPARAARFGYVSRVQLDTDGGLLVSDQTNSCIRKILPPL